MNRVSNLVQRWASETPQRVDLIKTSPWAGLKEDYTAQYGCPTLVGTEGEVRGLAHPVQKTQTEPTKCNESLC
jgi:hypothetical protein